MIKRLELEIAPKYAFDEEVIEKKALGKEKLKKTDVKAVVVAKRSLDARRRKPIYRLFVDIFIDEEPPPANPYIPTLKHAAALPEVLIIGAGPAGYFAGLKLLEHGLRPIIIDRGKTVQARRKDLRSLQQESIVDPDSNYCFGEGGAGTFSDGKLYTSSKKRGDTRKVFEILVEHGAPESILVDRHPHIGSNILPKVVKALRKTILDHGGEIYFESRVTDFLIEKDTITGVRVNDSKDVTGSAVILATGHSARDIYALLESRNIQLEAKPFAIGVRLEHPQHLIDKIQYHQHTRSTYLPAANYKLVARCEDRGIFSFCMCPGGIIVPAATAPGEIVVNGMSLSKRNSRFANSGIVVTLNPHDFEGDSALAGLHYQRMLEKKFFDAGDGSQKCPAQRMVDFTTDTLSTSLPETSYIPGIYSAPLHEMLPPLIADNLKKAFAIFDQKKRGFLTNEAVLTGLESRTSSPVRIPRDPDTLEHVQIKNLYPCGEGAGYAGGIMSAAMDGQKIAQTIAEKHRPQPSA